METSAALLWHAGVRSRDEAAFAKLVRPAIPHALGAARRSGLDPAGAEDVVQECLADLARERSDRPAEVGAGVGNCLIPEGIPGGAKAIDTSAWRFDGHGNLVVPDAPGFGLRLA